MRGERGFAPVGGLAAVRCGLGVAEDVEGIGLASRVSSRSDPVRSTA